MILHHYSEKPFVLDRSRKYDFKQSSTDYFKPQGLWLSDEKDFGWNEWCRGQEFGLERLQFETLIEIDMERVIHISNDDDLLIFDSLWNELIFPGGTYLKKIDWKGVKDTYAGILISPHLSTMRFDLSWYSSWDCASGCIWDLSIITKVSESKPFLSQSRMKFIIEEKEKI